VLFRSNDLVSKNWGKKFLHILGTRLEDFEPVKYLPAGRIDRLPVFC
jgi:hypothetical protein